MLRLGIMGSTRGTHLLSLINGINEKKLMASIEVVVSNKSDALILQRAREHQLIAECVEKNNLTREQHDQKTSEILHFHSVDLVVLVGYMRILSAAFIEQWRNKIINVHPSLLPDFAGGMDADVHRAVLESGVKETGCTVHYVTDEVDGGPILMQRKCRVLSDDTVDSLKSRVQNLEAETLIEVINEIIKCKHAK